MKILVVTPFEDNGWVWLSKHFPEHEWCIVNLNLFGRNKFFWFTKALQSIKGSKKYDIIITHAPYMTLCVALALFLTLKAKKTKHYAFSFNHGNGLFFKGLLLKIAKKVFKYTSGFVVYSKAERGIFNRKYDIGLDKISFCHWAVNPPEVDKIPASYISNAKPYVSCMGRNNRDFETFIQVMGNNPQLNAIIVCPEFRLLNIGELPSNIIIKHDLPLKEAMTILANSIVSVVPIKDVSTGAGHMTIVAAMQLGIPQLITRLETVDDYFLDNKHGFYIDQGNVNSMSEKLNELIGDTEFYEVIRKETAKFSEKWLMEHSAVTFLKKYFDAIQNDKALPKFPS